MLKSSIIGLPAILLLLCAASWAVDPLDFLFSSNIAQYPRYRQMSSSGPAMEPEFEKKFWLGAPPGCICTKLGCSGPGCMRRMYPVA